MSTTIQAYKDFAPTSFDSKGAFLGDDRQEWLVAPVSRTRDSGPLDESNFVAALEMLGGESETCEVYRFGHWGPGWFEIIIVAPERRAELEAIIKRLDNYPVLNEDDLSKREQEEADRVWKDCYDARERVRYIRENRSQFEFRSLADMLGCVRGGYFAGYASELLG